jgi:hypothetical protein
VDAAAAVSFSRGTGLPVGGVFHHRESRLRGRRREQLELIVPRFSSSVTQPSNAPGTVIGPCRSPVCAIRRDVK